MRAALIAVLFLMPTIAAAQCFGRHWMTGQPVRVHEASGPTFGNAYAVANWAPNGWPMVTYGPRFFKLKPLLQTFVKYHECAHVSVPTVDEVQANCVALKAMRQHGLTEQQERQIAEWTIAEGKIGFQYGGDGAAFWEYTIACAGSR